MRILSLDHGTRRIGVALSDEMKIIASPLEFIPSDPFENVIARLGEIIREKEVELILIGMPRNMDGTYGPAAEKVKEFIALLQTHITTPIKTWSPVLPPRRPTACCCRATCGAISASRMWIRWRRPFSSRATSTAGRFEGRVQKIPRRLGTGGFQTINNHPTKSRAQCRARDTCG